ncbi:hypothetical protein ACQ4PT_054696 [Festuca glaucescens]
MGHQHRPPRPLSLMKHTSERTAPAPTNCASNSPSSAGVMPFPADTALNAHGECTPPDPYGGRNPTWNAALVIPTAEEAKGGCLHILLRAERTFGADGDVGEVIVPVPEVLTGGGLGAPNMPQFASYQVRKVHCAKTRGLLYLMYHLGPIVVTPPANDWPVVGYPVQQEMPPPPSSPTKAPLKPAGHVDVPFSPTKPATHVDGPKTCRPCGCAAVSKTCLVRDRAIKTRRACGHAAISKANRSGAPFSKLSGYTTMPSKPQGHVAVPPSPKPTGQVPPSPKPPGYTTAPSKSEGHVAVPPSPKPTGQVVSMPPSPKPSTNPSGQFMSMWSAPSKSEGHVVVPPSPKPTGQVPPSPKTSWYATVPSKSEGHVAVPPSPKPTGQVPPSPKPSGYVTAPSKSEGHVAVPPSPKPTGQVPPSPKPSWYVIVSSKTEGHVAVPPSPKLTGPVVSMPPLPSPKPAGHEVSMPPSPKPADAHVAMLSSPKPFGRHASPTQYDIDECKSPKVYPCYSENCQNRLNGYDCPCKPGFKGDGKQVGQCSERFPTIAKTIVGAVAGVLVMAFLSFIVIIRNEQRKTKEFYRKNGGPTLEKIGATTGGWPERRRRTASERWRRTAPVRQSAVGAQLERCRRTASERLRAQLERRRSAALERHRTTAVELAVDGPRRSAAPPPLSTLHAAGRGTAEHAAEKGDAEHAAVRGSRSDELASGKG